MCVKYLLLSTLISVMYCFVRGSNVNTNPKRRAAAECVSKADECTPNIAEQSGWCKPYKFFYEQSEECRVEACNYCKETWGSGHNFCIRSWTITNRCKEIMSWVTPKPSTSLSSSPSSWNAATPMVLNDFDNMTSANMSPEASILPSPNIVSVLDFKFSNATPEVTPITTEFQVWSSTEPMASFIDLEISTSPKQNWTESLRAAAECVSSQDECTSEMAMLSGLCNAGIHVEKQPSECIDSACTYCGTEENKLENICKDSWAIKEFCPGIYPSVTPSKTATPSPTKSVSPSPTRSQVPSQSPSPSPSVSNTPTPTMSPTPSPQCLWKGTDDLVVISMANVKPFSFWSRSVHSDGKGGILRGIEWRADDDRTSIDSPGLGGFCVRVQFPTFGTYYFTAITAAPHKTEHNDMWLNFTGGLNLFNPGTHERRNNNTPFKTFKGYQNLGGDKIADLISTVNHNPHLFVTLNVNAGQDYNMCIDGRSSKFKVFKLVFLKCQGLDCMRTSTYVKSAMQAVLSNDIVSQSSC